MQTYNERQENNKKKTSARCDSSNDENQCNMLLSFSIFEAARKTYEHRG